VQKLFRLAPENAFVPRANRQFLAKAARFAAEQRIRQFIDLGAGLPSQGSTHEVVRVVQPGARVVYVDSDPGVLAHARALLPGNDSATRWREESPDPELDAAGSWTLAGGGRKN
jgi:trans-aconitate methyltransferase